MNKAQEFLRIVEKTVSKKMKCSNCGREVEIFGDVEKLKSTIQYCPICKKYTNHILR